MKHLLLAVLLIAASFALAQVPQATHATKLELLSSVSTGGFDEAAAEIAAYDASTQRLYVTNAQAVTVDILDLSDPSAPQKLASVDVTAYGGGANSVAAYNGVVAVAVENADPQQPGKVVFLDPSGNQLANVNVGALPDMLTFTPDGNQLLVANEGEPASDYQTDPEGAVSIIDLSGGVEALDQSAVRTVSFSDFNKDGPRHGELDPRIRIFGPNASVAQDLEPEYIAVSEDGATAWLTLQENNALATINIPSASVTRLVSLGFKDHSLAGNGFDASDKDGEIMIAPRPVMGMNMPDGIAAYTVGGATYLLTANEGDARDYDAYSEEARVGDESYRLNPERFPNVAALKNEAQLGRLTVTTASGDEDGNGDFETIYAFGGRSFSIWTPAGEQVFDSGDALEQLTAARYPESFNAAGDNNSPDTFDNRSDNKGPEPETVVVGRVDGRPYAFIALERISGVVIYDLSDPRAPQFVDYVDNRNFGAEANTPAAGDLSPEGLAFIPAGDSPTGQALLVTANEVSGTVSVFAVQPSD